MILKEIYAGKAKASSFPVSQEGQKEPRSERLSYSILRGWEVVNIKLSKFGFMPKGGSN